jgi:predicted acylesterase/phospholipase RssA
MIHALVLIHFLRFISAANTVNLNDCIYIRNYETKELPLNLTALTVVQAIHATCAIPNDFEPNALLTASSA